jgi:hypothetical protein
MRRKPSIKPPSHLHPLQFGQSLQNRVRKELTPAKHYKQQGNQF